MNVFDPSAGFNAFAQGAQIGGNIRQRQTEAKLAPMIANNDYDGAMKYAASRGDMASMDYLRPMQEKAAAEAYNKELGALMAAGNTKGAMANAFAAGKLDQGISLYNYDRALRADEITDYKSGIDYLVSNAERLKALSPEQRGEEALRIIQSSPWGQDQRVMAAVQQAAADGRLTDEEIDGFNMQLLSAGERLAQQNWQAGFQRDADWRAEDQEYRAGRDTVADAQWQAGHNLQAGKFTWEKEQAAADAEAGGTYGLNVVWGMDAQGNYVPMQAGKSGGLIASQMPEGVTPLGPYGTAFDSASGKAQAEKAALQSTAGKALLGFEAKADELVSQIDQAIEMSDFWNTGLTGNAVWSPDFNAILDSIGAKAMLSELVSIKEQGGTFGALSDSEGKALRDAAVNITKSQSEAQLDKNLKAYRDQVEKTRTNMRKAFEEEYINNPISRRVPPGSGGTNQPAPSIGPPVGTVRNGYRFKGGNPNDRNSWEPAQ